MDNAETYKQDELMSLPQIAVAGNSVSLTAPEGALISIDFFRLSRWMVALLSVSPIEVRLDYVYNQLTKNWR
jgi:hypothetical protein